MAERSNAVVLKTIEGNTSRGSNPFLSATGFVAQLVEQWIEAPRVGSSNLSESTERIKRGISSDG